MQAVSCPLVGEGGLWRMACRWGCDYILPCEGIEGTLSGFPSIDNLSGLQVPRAPHTVIAGKWIRIGLEMGYNWGQTLDKIAKF